MGEGDQRVGGVEIALEGTEIGLERPERQQHPARDAVFGFDPPENPGVFFGVGAPAVDAVLRDQPAREIDEGHLEHALGAIGAQHLGILGDGSEEGIDRGLVVAGGDRLGFKPVDEGGEGAAAFGVCAGRSEKRGGKAGNEAHGNICPVYVSGQVNDTISANAIETATKACHRRHSIATAASISAGPISRRPRALTQGRSRICPS
jgi:hypothetical protein